MHIQLLAPHWHFEWWLVDGCSFIDDGASSSSLSSVVEMSVDVGSVSSASLIFCDAKSAKNTHTHSSTRMSRVCEQRLLAPTNRSRTSRTLTAIEIIRNGALRIVVASVHGCWRWAFDEPAATQLPPRHVALW